MSQKTDRREFVKQGLALGAAALGAGAVSRLLIASTDPGADIAVVKGGDPFAAARLAVEKLGGMGKFVPRGSRVGLLINAPAWWRLPGSHACTEVVLAALTMALDAGAKEVLYLLDPSPKIWSRSPLSEKYADQTRLVKPCSRQYVETEVKRGVSLKTAHVIRELFECDVFIDIPIAKHHMGTNFSGCLKNYMGACQDKTNRYFHSGSGAKKEYDDVDFLSQCIADVNTLRKPTLCLVDATMVLGSGGPEGPGELLRPGCVLAGTDPVALDSLGVGLLGRKPEEIVMLKKAVERGIGTSDLAKLKVVRATV